MPTQYVTWGGNGERFITPHIEYYTNLMSYFKLNIGECGRMLYYIARDTDNVRVIRCSAVRTDIHDNIPAGTLPECTKCLVGICEELRGAGLGTLQT